MALAPYTSADDVRAALGVGPKELKDVTLALPLYENELHLAMLQLGSTFEATYAGLIATPPAANTPQAQLVRLAQVYCTYAVAKVAAPALPVFAPQDITDGKAAISRYASGYAELLERLEEKLAATKEALADLLAQINNTVRTTTPRVFISRSAGYDPVTGV